MAQQQKSTTRSPATFLLWQWKERKHYEFPYVSTQEATTGNTCYNKTIGFLSQTFRDINTIAHLFTHSFQPVFIQWVPEFQALS